MKTCCRCHVSKPLSAYWRRAASHDGLAPACKTCITEGRVAARPKQHRIKGGDWNTMMGDCSSCGPGVSLRKQGDYLHCEVKIIDSNRRKKMRQRYGIELEVYDSMVKTAQGKCAICGDVPKKPLCIDHDHSTGAVRGLLCSPCNSGLGQFRDRPERLLAAVEYLRKANVVA